MHIISSTEAKQKFGAALDAAQRSPVFIQKQNRAVAVLMSMSDYDKIRGLRDTEFERLAREISAKAAQRGLTDDKLEDILADVS